MDNFVAGIYFAWLLNAPPRFFDSPASLSAIATA
jgi:hypothetical protein